jgi:hypothetical protein
MGNAIQTTRVLTPFGSGYVQEQRTEAAIGNLPPLEPRIDFAAILSALRNALDL